MCFFTEIVFFGDFNVTTPQRRSSPHTHTLTLTNTLTLTHTHMTGQQWLVGQVVPEEFFSGFANIFGPQVVCKNFLARQGVTQHTKILSSES